MLFDLGIVARKGAPVFGRGCFDHCEKHSGRGFSLSGRLPLGYAIGRSNRGCDLKTIVAGQFKVFLHLFCAAAELVAVDHHFLGVFIDRLLRFRHGSDGFFDVACFDCSLSLFQLYQSFATFGETRRLESCDC